MRIIAGSLARRKLIPPADQATRPITDRVKESLFSILAGEVPGAIVADLFCGTGSLGLEALSRGAQKALFIDSYADALKRLKQNIQNLGLQDGAIVLKSNLFHRSFALPFPCDLVFLDPPYADSRETSLESPLGRLLCTLSQQIAPRGLLVLRQETPAEVLAEYEHLRLADQREYGRMVLSFLENERE